MDGIYLTRMTRYYVGLDMRFRKRLFCYFLFESYKLLTKFAHIKAIFYTTMRRVSHQKQKLLTLRELRLFVRSVWLITLILCVVF